MIKERRAVLIHSYLSDREGKDRPDRLTRAATLAALEMYRRGEVGKVCVTVEPGLSASIVKQINSISNIEENDLVVQPQTVTTQKEVKTFKRIAEREGWDELITIGNEAHLPRIKRVTKKHFEDSDIKISSVSYQDVLSKYPPRYQEVLNDMEEWPEQKSFERMENIVSRINKIPVVGKFILDILPGTVPGKVGLQLWAFRQMEKRKS